MERQYMTVTINKDAKLKISDFTHGNKSGENEA